LTRVAFVYPNPREAMLERIAAGALPDTNLLGQNHLAELGVDSFVYDSILRRHTRTAGAMHRATWHARELLLPWELGGTDLIVTPLATLLPIASRLRRRPRVVVVSYHLVAAFERANELRRRLLRTSLGCAARIVTIAETARAQLIDLGGLDPEQVVTAPLGVDDGFWQPTPDQPNGYVLTVGRDLARDYATFAAAVEGLPVRAILVAKEENLRGIDVPPNVEVRLNISAGEVRNLYAGAACVVVPIVPESNPRGTENSGTIALLEAMASGRPTIVSERSYLSEYIHPDATLTVAPSDPHALRETIGRVLSDPSLAHSMSEAARRHVEERHTSRQFAVHLASVIRGLSRAD
jgi:glycosyltransferase involved in cell wall biosynthesis